MNFEQLLQESADAKTQKGMIALLKREDTKLYKKSGTFKARKGKPGEHIVTVIDGEEETKKTVKDGEIVIKGPKGELYVVSESKFRTRYDVNRDPTDEWQSYKALGLIRAFEYEGVTFHFTASWDEDMLCKEGDFLAAPVKDADDKEYPEVYRIERSVFDDTYKEVKE